MKYIKTILLMLFSVVISIEIINNLYITSNSFIGDKEFIETTTKMLRMELWPYHLYAGIAISLIFIIFTIKDKNKYAKILYVISSVTGIYLFFYENKYVLVTHIIFTTIAFLYTSWFYFIKKLGWIKFLLRMFLFTGIAFLSIYYYLDADKVYDVAINALMYHNESITQGTLIAIEDDLNIMRWKIEHISIILFIVSFFLVIMSIIDNGDDE